MLWHLTINGLNHLSDTRTKSHFRIHCEFPVHSCVRFFFRLEDINHRSAWFSPHFCGVFFSTRWYFILPMLKKCDIIRKFSISTSCGRFFYKKLYVRKNAVKWRSEILWFENKTSRKRTAWNIFSFRFICFGIIINCKINFWFLKE